MYVVLLLGLLGLGASAVYAGWTRARPAVALLGGATLTATLGFFAFASLWGEYLWFEQLGFGERYLTQLVASGGTAPAGAALVAAVVALATAPMAREAAPLRVGAVAAGAVLGGAAGAGSWDVALAWMHRVPTGAVDPILGLDVGFYLFSLPLWDLVHGGLTLAVVLALGAVVWAGGSSPSGPARPSLEPPRPMHVALGAFALVLAAGRALAVLHLLGARHGAVYGANWTDVHVRMPALLLTGAALAIAGIALLAPQPRRAVEGWFERLSGDPLGARAASAFVPLAVAGTVWALSLGVFPSFVQALVVTPNELALERPYLQHAITATRRAYGLDRIEEREASGAAALSPDVLRENRHVLDEARLWDPHALEPTFGADQELRPYYEISDVDVDRYLVDGRPRQMLVAPRELVTRHLPPGSRTWVNRHFRYTHGYALAMAPAGEVGADGAPSLVVHGLPPVAEHPELLPTRPEIYFGEHTDDFVVVNTRAAEFDHPTHNGNAYTRYEGSGGVALDSAWRRFVYGWKLGGTSLVVSAYPDEGSRLMFRRNVLDRVEAVAPFLRIDRDPYLAVVEGRLRWIVDAYTVSSRYPYSEPVVDGPAASAEPRGATPWGTPYGRVPSELAGANYVRNSVKVVVDAYDGAVELYVVDPHDPLVQVWASVFPALFRPASDLSDGLRAHLRYPEELLRTQAQVYARYHVKDPAMLHDHQDPWAHATRITERGVRPIEATYAMWQPPGADRPEFVTLQPFTRKGRQELVGWMAGMSDAESYGRLIAWRFPADRRVLGPRQVQTRIDQDPTLSAQLTVWEQLGKRVIRGDLVPIPIGDGLAFVQPLFVQADDASRPELRVVVVAHGDDLSFAPTFDDALAGLAGGRNEVRAPDEDALREAREAFDAYLRSLGEERFEDAADDLRVLGEALGS